MLGSELVDVDRDVVADHELRKLEHRDIFFLIHVESRNGCIVFGMEDLEFPDFHLVVHAFLIIVWVLDGDDPEDIEDAVLFHALALPHVHVVVLTDNFVFRPHREILCQTEDHIGSRPDVLAHEESG